MFLSVARGQARLYLSEHVGDARPITLIPERERHQPGRVVAPPRTPDAAEVSYLAEHVPDLAPESFGFRQRVVHEPDRGLVRLTEFGAVPA
jgi:hypothetical protein